MQGTYLQFFLPEKQRHHGILAYEWLLEEARKLGLPGGSAFRAIAGYGRHGVLHEDHFFELAGDLPVAVGFALADTDAERLLAQLATAEMKLVYLRMPVSTGVVGGDR